MVPFFKKEGVRSRKEWVERCDALYLWHKEPIYRLALRALGGDREWALLVLETCMFIAYQQMDQIKDEKSESTKALMAAILKSVLDEIYYDTWKKMGFSETEEMPSLTKKDELYINQILIRNESTANLARYIGKMSRQEKELIFFRFFAGMPREAISARFARKPKETDAKIWNIKQKLAKMMTEG